MHLVEEPPLSPDAFVEIGCPSEASPAVSPQSRASDSISAGDVAIVTSLANPPETDVRTEGLSTSMWNHGTLQQALPECHRGDTPAVDLSLDLSPSSATEDAFNERDDDAGGDEPVNRSVSPAADNPSESPGSRASAADAEPAGSRDGSSCISEDDGDVPILSAPLGEWRLQVRVLHYQRTAQIDILWVAAGESIDDVLVRADILLRPEGDLFYVVVPEVQPTADCLTIVCIPRWWLETGIRAFVIAEKCAARCPFPSALPRWRRLARSPAAHWPGCPFNC